MLLESLPMDDWEMDEPGRQQLSELILAFQDIFAQNLEVQKELSMRSTLGIKNLSSSIHVACPLPCDKKWKG